MASPEETDRQTDGVPDGDASPPPRDGRPNGLAALDLIARHLTAIGWDPVPTDHPEVLEVDFSTEDLPVANIHFDVRVDYERLLIYFNLRTPATRETRDETMRFLSLVDYGLVAGNFELNPDDGSIRFKSGIDFTGVPLSEILFRNLTRSAMDAVEMYAEAVEDVAAGRLTAEQAIREVE